MLIAQMTDIHIGFAPDDAPEELNLKRFRAALARLLSAPNEPDMLVLSGDLTDRGDAESFAKTAALLEQCPFPVWPLVGNHDNREGLVAAFPHIRLDDGFAHYVVEQQGLRVVMLDTFEPGRHGGAFCERRQSWLTAQLNAAPGVPTLIFMHHPPVVSGIDWMDPAPDESWLARLGAALEGRSQIVAIHCGHLHRSMAASFCGIPVHVTPSVAPLVALDLRPVDPDQPDDRALITTEPPTYALHRWNGESLVSHYETVGDWQTIARYTDALQPMVRGMFAERG